jgi:hypothetical protein
MASQQLRQLGDIRAIRRASSLLIVDFEFGGIARKPLLLFGKCVVIFSVT